MENLSFYKIWYMTGQIKGYTEHNSQQPQKIKEISMSRESEWHATKAKKERGKEA